MEFTEFIENFDIKLNNQQLEAVKSIHGHILLLAVPGSGKTTVLVSRLGYMIYCRRIAPESILTMTYNVSAAQDMKSRFMSVFGNEYSNVIQFRTINSVCYNIIRDYERIYSRTAFTMAEELQVNRIIREILSRHKKDYIGENEIKAAKSLITYIKNMCLTDKEINALDTDQIPISAIYSDYRKTMREQSLMDFDDQMVYALNILKRYPDILKIYHDRYKYICVDEAQDTSKIQHIIIELLASECGNLFMVGDEDQSIYGFRAAYPEALNQFESKYENAKLLLMEENFRSVPEIISKADIFIRQNLIRHFKNMRATRKENGNFEIYKISDRESQYNAILNKVSETDTQTAVLYRDNDSAIPLMNLFDINGISFCCKKFEGGFFDSLIIRDLRDIIAFAKNPQNTEAFMRLYYKVGLNIGKATALKVCEYSKSWSKDILSILLASNDINEYSRKQVRIFRDILATLLNKSALFALKDIFNRTNYGKYIEKRTAEAQRKDIVISISRGLSSIELLLNRINELKGLALKNSNSNGVILSTIHSSKGLEYDRVIMIDAYDGIFPKIDSELEDYDMEFIEEERRLFYVGMTRAKTELIIMQCTDEDYSTSFIDSLYAHKRIAKKLYQTKQSFIKLSKTDIKDLLNRTKINSEVEHKTFGKGRVKEKKGQYYVVRFDDGKDRLLDFDLLLSNGNIIIID